MLKLNYSIVISFYRQRPTFVEWFLFKRLESVLLFGTASRWGGDCKICWLVPEVLSGLSWYVFAPNHSVYLVFCTPMLEIYVRLPCVNDECHSCIRRWNHMPTMVASKLFFSWNCGSGRYQFSSRSENRLIVSLACIIFTIHYHTHRHGAGNVIV